MQALAEVTDGIGNKGFGAGPMLQRQKGVQKRIFQSSGFQVQDKPMVPPWTDATVT